MRTINCRFTFTDGTSAEARLEAEGPEDFNPVQYSGMISLLQDRPERASTVGIKLWAEDAAGGVGCNLTIEESGDFDSWAE